MHGRLANVVCLGCGHRLSRQSLQEQLLALNPDWQALFGTQAPDGDAQLETDFGTFRIPECSVCQGFLKPDVVFFGEAVPAARVEESWRAIDQADCLLVAGSSLMVWSGLRFVRAASERRIPLALINLGRTRADALFSHRVSQSCGAALTRIADRLLSAAGSRA